MSDLSELRERLHLDLERVIGAAAIVELDADAMRAAIIDALEIHTVATTEADGVAKILGTDDARSELLAHAAERMVERLRELHRVHVSSEPFPEVEPGWGLEP